MYPARTDRYGDPLPAGALARLGTVRLRISGGPQFLAFRPDGRTLISTDLSTFDLHLCEWDVSTGKRLRIFTIRPVSAAVLSPDAGTLVTASQQPVNRPTQVRIWDCKTGNERRPLPALKSWAWAVALAPDGKTVATTEDDTIIRLWDPATGAEVRRLGDGRNQWRRLLFGPDGKTLAAASAGRTLSLWDPKTGRLLRAFQPHGQPVGVVAFSGDSRTIATAAFGDQLVHLWDRTTGKEIRHIMADTNNACLSFSPDGKTLATGGSPNFEPLWPHPIRLWDLRTGKERRLRGHRFGVAEVAFSPDGRTLASAGWDAKIRLWDVASGKERLPFPEHDGYVESTAFAPDGRTLATGGRDGTVRLWQAATGESVHEINVGSRVQQVAFAPDGKVLTAATERGPIRLWDPRTGKLFREFGEPDNRFSCAFSPDGRALAAGTSGGMIGVYDVTRGKEIRRFTTDEGAAVAIGFSPDARTLVGSNSPSNPFRSSRGVSVWDVVKGKRIRYWPLGKTTLLWPFALSPDGRTVAAGEKWPPSPSVRAIHLWDLHTGRQLDVEVPHNARMTSIAYSPDGRTLAWGNDDGTVVLWEVATGRVRRQFEPHASAVLALALSPDGRVLATGGGDSAVLLWDLARLAGADSAPSPSPEELDLEWIQLRGANAERAYRAVWRMAMTPRQSLPWLAERLRPAAAADPQRVALLIEELSSSRFAVRTRASRELERLGESAVPLLRKALVGQPPPDMRRRLEQLLEKQQGPAAAGDELRNRRAVEVLEHIGSADAQRLLRSLASGFPDARLTVEAKASLARLEMRPTRRAEAAATAARSAPMACLPGESAARSKDERSVPARPCFALRTRRTIATASYRPLPPRENPSSCPCGFRPPRIAS
jgi:WD40 repeat protein